MTKKKTTSKKKTTVKKPVAKKLKNYKVTETETHIKFKVKEDEKPLTLEEVLNVETKVWNAQRRNYINRK